jgi:hypothetical protein
MLSNLSNSPEQDEPIGEDENFNVKMTKYREKKTI